MSDLHQPQFQDPDKAREYLEAQVWPNGPVCPHCGAMERMSKIEGGRPGLWFCGHCRKQYTVTVGSVFERSKIPLHKWLLAVHLLCSSKKGMSSHQLHRMLGVTYKTAWFMTHRIREAFKMPHTEPMGGSGKIVEADETFFGRKPHATRTFRSGSSHKHKIFSMVERDGKTRSFHVADVTAKTLKPILQKQVAQDTRLLTDSAWQYKNAAQGFQSHETVNHLAGEYARDDVHTNTVESFFGLLKRGLVGTYHHVSEAHLQRYCTEFDFRFSHRKVSDTERSNAALKLIKGKRLTYRRVSNEA
jgi:transposase-like protein